MYGPRVALRTAKPNEEAVDMVYLGLEYVQYQSCRQREVAATADHRDVYERMLKVLNMRRALNEARTM